MIGLALEGLVIVGVALPLVHGPRVLEALIAGVAVGGYAEALRRRAVAARAGWSIPEFTVLFYALLAIVAGAIGDRLLRGAAP